MDLQETLNSLAQRVAKLEAARPRRRVHNPQEAARELGMSVKKLREEMKAGRIKGALNGRVWMLTDEEIQRYISEGDT
jgi:Helix-turn-helix domain